MSSEATRSSARPPAPVLAATACIWAVVVLGIMAVVFIVTLYFEQYRSEIVPLIVGQVITVILPAVLTVFITAGATWAWILYLLLSVVGVTLRGLGLVESLSAGLIVISVLQAGSILLTLTAMVLLSRRTVRRYFRNARVVRRGRA
ncbi:hypothetical protein GCM10022223_61790 [Kineosporia mesophila]|uniref:Integral membrane protein n=1 Tax=Kineosporia mesophila TaxID=566012 RepID=A0ABP7ALE9_9ACTN|nr:hypothetical protein [Kineosporia mesophila]MCD5354009.1 hypothetical protein [Kineosporia mesophila]